MHLRLAWLFIPPFSYFLSQHALAEDTVTVCDSCTTASQFQIAARNAVSGTRLNSEVLVVNPVTEQALWVSVLPRAAGVNNNGEGQSVKLLAGEVATLSTNSEIVRGSVELERISTAAASGYDFVNRDLTAGEKQEVGDLIRVSGKDHIILLPPDEGSGFYASYNESIAEGAKLYVFNKINDSYKGILTTALASRFRQLLPNRLRAWFGKPSRICSVYNNGDSTCWEIDLACVSCNTSIPGTAKDANGNIIPSTGTSTTRGDGLTVVPGNGSVSYGPAGATGSHSEVWLLCSYIAGRITTCYLQKF